MKPWVDSVVLVKVRRVNAELAKTVAAQTKEIVEGFSVGKIEHAYAVVAHGGSGNYEHTEFLGLAFSWSEVKALIEGNQAGPCPGDQWEITRRRIGSEGSRHMTVWACEDLDNAEKRKWQ